MAERPLSADEAALWRRVLESVRPIDPKRPLPTGVEIKPAKVPKAKPATTAPVPAAPVAKQRPGPGITLDGSWDKKLATGSISPDSAVDLHGDTLDRAYARIDFALEAAIARGDRVILLVTGKPGARGGRGSIRALVGDWLAASRHAGAIAAVRPAHPRHGGAGALYLVLRRR